MSDPMYFIKEGYQPRLDPMYFVDDVERERGVRYQPDVYTFAERCAEREGKRLIIDVGCGHADKLADLHFRHPDWEFIGIDIGVNIEWCRSEYGWGNWLNVDLEREHAIGSPNAVVIASDVIEHLVRPEKLLRSIIAGTVVLSTPERDLCWGHEHMGPSPNLCHVREWNLREFKVFVNSEGLDGWFGLTRSNDAEPHCRTILAVVTH